MIFRLLSPLLLSLCTASVLIPQNGEYAADKRVPTGEIQLLAAPLSQDTAFWNLSVLDLEAETADYGENQLFLYPSPAQNWVNLEWNDSRPGEVVMITFYDGNGQKIYSTTQAAEYDISLSLEKLALPAGMYTVEAQSSAKRISGRFLKI